MRLSVYRRKIQPRRVVVVGGAIGLECVEGAFVGVGQTPPGHDWSTGADSMRVTAEAGCTTRSDGLGAGAAGSACPVLPVPLQSRQVCQTRPSPTLPVPRHVEQMPLSGFGGIGVGLESFAPSVE